MNQQNQKNESHGVYEIDLLEFLRAVLKNLFLIILVAVLIAGMMFAYARYLVTPMYKTSAMIYVNNNKLSLGSASVADVISSGDISAAKSLVNTYIVILNSRTTLDQVIERTGLNISYESLKKMISAASVENTEIFSITVKGTDPEQTKLIANTICEVLPETISEIVDGSAVRIVDYAVSPTESYAPSFVKYTAGGFVIGALLAILYVFISFMTDDIIHGEEDLTSAFDIPILAGIPDLTADVPAKYKYYGGKRSGKKGF